MERVLRAIRLLAGEEQQQQQKGTRPRDLAAVLERRLGAANDVLPHHQLGHDGEQQQQAEERGKGERETQEMFASAALRLLELLGSALLERQQQQQRRGANSSSIHRSSTSSSAEASTSNGIGSVFAGRATSGKTPESKDDGLASAPVLGLRDVQAVRSLAGALAQWGLALPHPSPSAVRAATQARDRGGARPTPRQQQQRQSGQKIVEITSDDEREGKDEDLIAQERRQRALLSERANDACSSPTHKRALLERAIRLVVGDDTPTPTELRALVLPGLTPALIDSLVRLAAATGAGAEHEQSTWARAQLEALTSSHTLAGKQHQQQQSIIPLASLFGALLATLSRARARRDAHTARVANELLARNLASRRNAVKSLLALLLEAQDDVQLEKLERTARLLAAPPPPSPASSTTTSSSTTTTGTQVREAQLERHYANISSQLIEIVQDAARPNLPREMHDAQSHSPPPPPANIVHAATFILAHLVDRGIGPARRTIARLLHAPLLPGLYPPAPSPNDHEQEDDDDEDDEGMAIAPPLVSASELFMSILTQSIVLAHAPPSTSLVSSLLLDSRALAALFELRMYLCTRRADGKMQNELDAVLEALAASSTGSGETDLATKLRDVVERLERGDVLSARQSAMVAELGGAEEERYEFARSVEGSVCVRERAPESGVDEMGEGEASRALSLDADLLYATLRDTGFTARKAAMRSLWVRWLDELVVLRSQHGLDSARRAVVRLQLVLAAIDDVGAEELVKDAREVLRFVAYALDDGSDDNAALELETKDERPVEAGIGNLRFVDDDEEEERERIAEDEQDGGETGLGKDELAVTALTLLLAVFEKDEALAPSNTPVLALIERRVSALANAGSPVLSPLAQEAQGILALRRAATLGTASETSSAGSSRSGAKPDPLAASRERYQEALKLLQDPILPVRAQALAILRSLVGSRDAFLATDPALLPAILDIFVRAVADDDSFLYLSAVQGLSGMVDSYGRQMVARLAQLYTGDGKPERGLASGVEGERALDKRLRIGEALVQVIQRAGEAFASLANDIVPPLMLVLRSSAVPTPLRTSTLTILATAVETAPVAMLNQVNLLVDACLTILSLESQPMAPRTRHRLPTPPASDDDDGEGAPQKAKRPEETLDPLSASTKHPALRRAAILFVGLLFRQVNRYAEDELERAQTMNTAPSISLFPRAQAQGRVRSSSFLSPAEVSRAATVLRYIGDTDIDALVRHQARSVLEEIED